MKYSRAKPPKNPSSRKSSLLDFLLRFGIFFALFISNFSFGQKFILIDSQNQAEFKRSDSAQAVKFLDSLAENYYYFTKILSVEKLDNSTKIIFDKGKNYNTARVKIPETVAKKLQLQTDFFTKNLDSLKKEINKKYAANGYVFSRVKSKYLGMNGEVPVVEIEVDENRQRTIDAFALRGYDKVPKRFVKNLVKDFQGKIYDEKRVLEINRELQNHPFAALEKPPQTLFTKDSTTVFLFLQKKKTNSFDGIIGFGNNKTQKFSFNGTLDLQFRNMFNGFESIGFYWQRNPDRGQTFDLRTDIPYLFKSNVGADLRVNIFRQDSTYANVKLLPSVYFHISSRQKLGLRGAFESSTVLDSTYTSARDFSKKGAGIWYDFTEPTEVELFLFKSKIRAEADFLSTKYDDTKDKSGQTQYNIFAERNFHLGGNHWLNAKGQSALLSSKNDFSANELLQFGGWNSMRGFNENSLLADFYYYAGAEYRYLVNNSAFFDFFAQYGGLNNKLLKAKPQLYSFGLGFNFSLPIGLMSFQISNGNEFGNPVKFSDTKIHWGILSRF